MGFQTALDALDAQECAGPLGAVNGEAAKMILNGMAIAGAIQRSSAFVATAVPAADEGWSFSYTAAISSGSTITVSSTVFFNPTALIGSSPYNILQVVQNEFNLSSLTAQQFHAIFLLHELGHQLGGLQSDLNPDGSINFSESEKNTLSADEKRKFYDACIK